MKAMFRVLKETTLVIKILIGLVLGALLGILIPKATFLSVPGDLFVGALKEIAPLLVFVLVRGLIRDKRAGKSPCGGNCSGCGGCASCIMDSPCRTGR